MKIHEYQAKEIFSKYGIPVERHTLCRTAAGAVAAYRRMGSDRVVIKAQVLTGGRGKAGGVKLVDNTEDAYQEAEYNQRNHVGHEEKQYAADAVGKTCPGRKFVVVELCAYPAAEEDERDGCDVGTDVEQLCLELGCPGKDFCEVAHNG